MEATDSFLFTYLQQEVERCQVWCVCFWQVGCPSTLRPLSPACQESPNQDIFTSGTQKTLHLLASHSQFSSCQVARLWLSLPIPSPTRPSLLSAPGFLVPCAPPPLPSGPNRVPPSPPLPSPEGRAQGPGVSWTRWPAVRRSLRPQAGAAPPAGEEPAHLARSDRGRALTEILRRRKPRSASNRHPASEPSLSPRTATAAAPAAATRQVASLRPAAALPPSHRACAEPRGPLGLVVRTRSQRRLFRFYPPPSTPDSAAGWSGLPRVGYRERAFGQLFRKDSLLLSRTVPLNVKNSV